MSYLHALQVAKEQQLRVRVSMGWTQYEGYVREVNPATMCFTLLGHFNLEESTEPFNVNVLGISHIQGIAVSTDTHPDSSTRDHRMTKWRESTRLFLEGYDRATDKLTQTYDNLQEKMKALHNASASVGPFTNFGTGIAGSPAGYSP